ncbi:MAG TPA: Zn-ribbon domain-containing OB-fold protein [Gaiellaceae bacterium]
MTTGSMILPEIDDVNRLFWEGCLEGVLRAQRCLSCGRLRYPISTICPHCLSTELEWVDLSGRGEIYSFVVFRHVYNEAWRDRVPYAVALVQLEEGVTMIANIVEVAPEAIEVGQPVEVAFEELTPVVRRPAFRPATGSGAA